MAPCPSLPKRYAATIRGAQAKVTQARLSILIDEQRIEQDELRIAEFEANPVAFAAKYYGSNGVDLYPVQTNISRCREGLEYRLSKRGRQMDGLRRAEDDLEDVSARVLMEVSKMRPSSGRVPWPAPLPSFETYRAKTLAHWDQEERAYEAQRAREEAAHERLEAAEYARAKAETEREFQQAKARLRERRAGLSVEQRDAEDAAAKELLSALKNGTITFADVLAHLRSRS